jgi:formylglycine-generating enzyme required for sulfatase activity
MYKKLLSYAWLAVIVLIAYPYTLTAESDTPTAGQIWKEPVTGMEFVWVPKGCYEMGCGSWADECKKDEKPAHEVCLDGFWMGKTEVTQGQWKQIMGNNPAKFQKGDNYPVENVYLDETKKFTKKLSALNNGAYQFRLPTEAEWEYACRSGGKQEKYAGGAEVEKVAWHLGNSGGSTHPVAAKAPNGLGLYDMSGNVSERVEDHYFAFAYRKHQRNNPVYKKGEPYRSYRGGHWTRTPDFGRCLQRWYDVRAYRGNVTGFRLVRNK